MGRIILGFNRQRQGFDGPQVETRHLFGVILFIIEPAQVNAIRAVNQVHQRHNQHGGLPPDIAAGKARQTRHGGAQQIVRERPQVAFFPHFEERLALTHGNDYSDRNVVDHEEGAGGEHQLNGFFEIRQVSQRHMQGELRGADGERGDAHVKRCLHHRRAAAVMPNALHQREKAAQQHGFRRAEFD